MSEMKTNQDVKKVLESKKDKEDQRKWREKTNRYALRRRVKSTMKRLTLFLEEIQRANRKQAVRDFGKIFKDEQAYFRMLAAFNEAYKVSYKSKEKLASEENWDLLRRAALNVGIFVSEKEMFDRNRRDVLWKKLKRKGRRDGKDYLEELSLEIWRQQFRPEPRWTVFCPECGVKQFPTISINPCPKCGFRGPVLPDLYSP